MFLCIEKRYGKIYLKLVIVVSLESKTGSTSNFYLPTSELMY